MTVGFLSGGACTYTHTRIRALLPRLCIMPLCISFSPDIWQFFSRREFMPSRTGLLRRRPLSLTVWALDPTRATYEPDGRPGCGLAQGR